MLRSRGRTYATRLMPRSKTELSQRWLVTDQLFRGKYDG